MATAIKIENVSKLYRLGEVGTGTMSHDLARWWATLSGKEDPYSIVGQVNRRDQAADSNYVWALRDVNLEIEQGEVLGIIGANGAGKSTLLKLISRITSPTSGRIKVRGRIASLLEVGTGMNPEMTARENIYLNGSVLGMRRHEITRTFDEIIDFAGCRMFVDTPIKRFSSGMQVRLGFAVAAFLEPEILIVDEVLAVGDAQFQDHALGKMQEVTKSGRTVLFVSHSMTSIQRLCPKSALMAHGTIVDVGSTPNMVQQYLSLGKAPRIEWKNADINKADSAITRVWIQKSDGNAGQIPTTADTLEIHLECRILNAVSDTRIAVAINDRFGTPIIAAMPGDDQCEHPTKLGIHRYTIRLPGPILRAQPYSITAALYSKSRLVHHKLAEVLRFAPEEANSQFMKQDNDRVGTIQIPCHWTHETSPDVNTQCAE